MAVAALLLRGAASHEGPLDGSLGGLCEGKGPCDLEHTCRRNQHTQSHVCVIFYQSINYLTSPVSLLKNSPQSFPEAALNLDLALYFPPHRTGRHITSSVFPS